MDSIRDFYALSERLGLKLKAKFWTLALAESCTGGLLAAALTQVPGSSQWFECGVVSYSNAAKIKLLHVDESVLAEHGAVSEASARLMAEGALAVSSAQLALSITGIAGPEGGSTLKPVGLVYFGLSSQGNSTQIKEQHFQGDRAAIRAQSVHYALECLLSVL